MKYIVMLGDGMADWPIPDLGNKTVLETAVKPHIDSLAPRSLVGLVRTVPEGMKPGSDVANLSVMGFDPRTCYTGRSPLEAVSLGIALDSRDVAIRCNLVTLSDEKDLRDRTMLDYSAGEISSQEAKPLIEAVQKALGNDAFRFYPGISYRHCLIWKNGKTGLALTPPHDISDRPVADFLPRNAEMYALMEKSFAILKDHPMNVERIKQGLAPANSIWLWGEGTKPGIPDFYKTYGHRGAVISAVDLVKGIGLAAGLASIDVEGATGTVDTNYQGKLEAALQVLLQDQQDFVYIHCEGPDECGHHGDIPGKQLSIERIDALIVGPLMEALHKAGEEFSLLILPDHPTPVSIKTHSSDPVPFLLYRSNAPLTDGPSSYNERTAKETGCLIEKGHTLLSLLFNQSG